MTDGMDAYLADETARIEGRVLGSHGEHFANELFHCGSIWLCDPKKSPSG
jgi:hypothetical protein